MGKMFSSLTGFKKDSDVAPCSEVFESAVEFVDVGDGAVAEEDAMSESRRVFVGVAAIDNSSKSAIDSSRWFVLEKEK